MGFSKHSLVSATLLSLLCACGGGGGDSGAPTPATPTPKVCSTCSPGILSGTIATGGAASAAEILVIDALGKSLKIVADAHGAYRADVSGMTAPFLIKVVGNVGGEAVILHSLATAGDIGKNAVNVTPLTELVTASVLGGIPDAKLVAGAVDLSKVTSTTLANAERTVKGIVQPVLDAAGASDANVRTTEFKPDRTGIDKALDATRVAVGGAAYSVSLVTGAPAVTLDPAKPADSKTLTAPSAQTLDDLSANLSAIQTRLDALAAQFANGVPSADALKPFFSDSFHHDGQDAASFIANVLRQVDADSVGGFSYQGVHFDGLHVENAIDADTLEVSYRVVFRAGFRASDERMVLKRVAGNWLLAGNGLAARARVSLMARLKETPLTETQLRSLPGVSVYSLLGVENGWTKYEQAIKDNQGNNLFLYLGQPGQDFFGTIGFAGAEWGTAERLARFNYNRYYAKPDSRVSNYMVFEVPTTRVAAKVTAITVTGPGLPPGGLALEAPSRRARPYWVFKGDEFDWNAFNADRCLQLNNASNPIASCGMDWSQVTQGGEYVFTMKDAAGKVVATQTDRLRGNPVNEAEAFAQKDTLFPQFTLDEAHGFSYRNFFNDSDGPFLPGKPITLQWSVPAQLGFRIVSVGMSILTPKLDASGNWLRAGYDEFAVNANHYNVDPAKANPVRTVFTSAHKILPQGGWTTLSGVDAFGNVWEHELSPSNPI